MESNLQQEPSESIWREMFPLLDEALARLRQNDRDALVLRYFENRSLQEVAVALGLKERAAQKRVMRSLEKLRHFFLQRGIAVSASAIAGAVSANSVQAAPVGLSASIAAVVKTPAATPFAVTGALKTMARIRFKLMLANTSLIIALGGVGSITVEKAFALHWFGLGGTRFHTSAWVVSGSSASAPNGTTSGFRGYAEPLTIYNPGGLSLIEAPIHSIAGRLNLSLAEDNNGIPGKVIENFSSLQAPHVGGTNVLRLESVAHPQLFAKAKYWLCIEPSDPDTMALWFYSMDLPPRNYVVEKSPGDWVPAQWSTNEADFWNYPNNITRAKSYFATLVVTPQ